MKIREHPPSTLRNVDSGPPGGVEAEDLRAPPSTLRNINGKLPGGAGAKDPGVPTINAKKRQWWARGWCRS
jgi:hypothetical protein